MPLSLKKRAEVGAPARGERPARAKKAKAPGAKKQQFILFVGDDGAILVFMEGKTVQRRLFAPTAAEEHTRTIIDLMNQHPKAPISLLFDVIDQQYVRQSFPPVSPLSVQGLVKRRLDRDFAAEDLRGALRVGREDTARKDWIYLLIALTNTPNYQQWVDLVVEQPNHLSGLHLVPVEGQGFIPMLAASMPNRPEVPAVWQLLISHHKVSGLRIIVLRDGKLAFTRVSQAVGEAVAAVIAGNVEQEIQNTIEYIRRLGYTESSGLEVFALLAAEVRDSIDVKRVNASAIHLLSPLDVAEALGLHQAALAADRFGDVVMASAFALNKKHVLRLYPAYAKKLDQLYKARLGAKAAAALLVLLMVGLTAKNVIGGFSASAEIRQTKASIAQNDPVIASLNKEVENLGVAVNLKNDVAAFYEKMKPLEYTPLGALKDMAALRTDEAKIDEWKWTRPSNLPDQNGNMPPPASPPADGSAAPVGPITIEAKVILQGNYLDNQMIMEAVAGYRTHIESALKEYVPVINNSEFGADSASKISVALTPGTPPATTSNPDSGGTSAGTTSPTLQITLTGPKAPEANANGEPSNGGQP